MTSFHQLLLLLASLCGVACCANVGVRTYIKYARSICTSICCVGCTLALDTIMVPSAHAAISQESMSRWTQAYDELKSLDSNWDTIVKGDHDGDSIRRKLGTVYTPPKCESALCSFSDFVPKFMVKNGEDIDIDEFEGPSQDLVLSLNEANAAAYNAIFCPEFATPSAADYIKTSRKQVKMSIKSMSQIIKILDAVQ